MKKLIALALSAGICLTATAASTINIINKSGWDLHEIYISPASQDDWGDDYLGSEILAQGDSLSLTGLASGKWDIRVIDEDGDECILNDVHITTSESWTVTEDDLLACQAAN